ncbi:23S rRNA pseudouridine955/2504/2580 synthase [Butyrivibrio sp. ob235]|uniref:RluA family pseudouridine synthase n=1 Tax=Butyrivibrio sp. ob235 TaxID=1761780 RepID=UPI0008D44B45|nr:RluA family pseudouridine synthase [Butyrivibrio sp. ob235]SEK33263.1 23S rRNA pseudouridine955/2504/2580 synthase [Butyrivibrio sp. ob235]
MREIKIDKNSTGKRLDKFLGSYFTECSMGFLFKMLRKKNITLNGKKASGKEALKEGDVISVFFSDETFYKFANKHVNALDSGSVVDDTAAVYERAFAKFGDLEIIYEDENILLLNKPCGILSQKSEAKDLSINEWLIGYLLNRGEISKEGLATFRPSVCNRLDRNTSGLLICSKSLPGARKMANLLKDRTLHKYYRTIVIGNIVSDSHLSGYLFKDRKTNKVVLTDTKPDNEQNDLYSPVETSFKVMGHGALYISDKKTILTELEVLLHTGKTHQIRAHLSSEGHPLIGDTKYGNEQTNKIIKSEFGLKYQLLHSSRLEFPIMADDFSYLSGRIFEAELPAIYSNIKSKLFS